MATLNLLDKVGSELDKIFTRASLTDAWCGNAYDWEGVNAIKVLSLTAGDLTNYNATASSNRFGTPSEVEDELNTYTLTKKRSFAKTFDITNVQDQMFKKRAAAYLQQMWLEKYVPEMDSYRLLTWANGAGLGCLNTTALTKSTVIQAIYDAHAAIDDKNVPSENRVTFVSSAMATAIRLASELAYNQNWTSKTIVNGQVTDLNGPVVTVPASRLPSGVEFMIKYKSATADPMKLKMLRANDNAPGIAGTLMEGLARYDAFVLAQKANGIYVYANTNRSSAVTAVAENSADNKLSFTLSASSTGTLYFTTDGTNPKTSSTRLSVSVSAASTGTYGTALANGTYTVRAYFQDGTATVIASPIYGSSITLAHA